MGSRYSDSDDGYRNNDGDDERDGHYEHHDHYDNLHADSMTTDHHGNSFHVRLSVWIDAITYATAITTLVTLIALLLGLVTGGGPSQAKFTLFIVGFLLLGYATVRLWPSTPSDLDTHTELAGVEGDSIPEVADQTRFQAFVQQLPPLRWVQSPPPEARIRTPGKLLLGSIAVLLVSFLMETVFGI